MGQHADCGALVDVETSASFCCPGTTVDPVASNEGRDRCVCGGITRALPRQVFATAVRKVEFEVGRVDYA